MSAIVTRWEWYPSEEHRENNFGGRIMHFCFGVCSVSSIGEHVGRDMRKIVGDLGLQLLKLICARDTDLRNQSSKYCCAFVLHQTLKHRSPALSHRAYLLGWVGEDGHQRLTYKGCWTWCPTTVPEPFAVHDYDRSTFTGPVVQINLFHNVSIKTLPLWNQ